jgi:mannan endo-1,4-beta-mannosidase
VNNHYLPWGSNAEVTRVLDDAVAMGANVVRTFTNAVIGSLDGTTVPTIWKFHNDQANSSDLNVHGDYLLYWDTSTRGMAINAKSMQKIDFLIAEAGKRHLRLILAFLDFWAYTGGAQQMRAWYGSKDENSFFFSDQRTINDYKAWVAFVVQRVNSLTGIEYRNDSTIFAWELMNESQAPPSLGERWTATMSAYVKSLDPNHLVGSGEGALHMAEFSIPTIDFVTWHGYPRYLGITPKQYDSLITDRCNLAARYHKPVVLEEFGHARSNTNPNQAQAYKMWLNTMGADRNCAGWLVWRLVARQDDGRYPEDEYDQFDVHHDDRNTWQVLSNAAHLGRAVADEVGTNR